MSERDVKLVPLQGEGLLYRRGDFVFWTDETEGIEEFFDRLDSIQSAPDLVVRQLGQLLLGLGWASFVCCGLGSPGYVVVGGERSAEVVAEGSPIVLDPTVATTWVDRQFAGSISHVSFTGSACSEEVPVRYLNLAEGTVRAGGFELAKQLTNSVDGGLENPSKEPGLEQPPEDLVDLRIEEVESDEVLNSVIESPPVTEYVPPLSNEEVPVVPSAGSGVAETIHTGELDVGPKVFADTDVEDPMPSARSEESISRLLASAPDTTVHVGDVPLEALRDAVLQGHDVHVSEGSQKVEGKACPECSELNSPSGFRCRVCSADLTDVADLVVADRPTLGYMLFDDGVAHPVAGPFVIGRSPELDYFVDSQPADIIVATDDARTVSRAHLEIRVAGWQVSVVDLDSANGSFVESGRSRTKLKPHVAKTLSDGDKVHFGERFFDFRAKLDHE